jgi:hypothetical protein
LGKKVSPFDFPTIMKSYAGNFSFIFSENEADDFVLVKLFLKYLFDRDYRMVFLF